MNDAKKIAPAVLCRCCFYCCKQEIGFPRGKSQLRSMQFFVVTDWMVGFLAIIRLWGFGFWTSWLWMLFLEGPLLVPTGERWGIEANTIFMVFMLCNAGSLLYQGSRLRPRTFLAGKVLPVSAGIMFLSPLLLACFPSLFQVHSGWLVLLATMLSGIGSSMLGAGWLESFAKMRLAEAAGVFAGGTVVAGALTIVAAHVPYPVGIGAVALLPVFSYLLLRRQADCGSSPDNGPPPVVSESNPFSARLIILFALLYTAGGLMFKIVSLEQTYPYLFYLANGSYGLVCFLVGLALNYKPSLDLRFLYRPVLPFLGAGFILFVAKVQYALLPFLLLQAGFALFDMYTWLLIAHLARLHARPATVCCFGMFLITFFIFSGNVIFSLWTWLVGSSVDSLAMIAGILSMMAVLVFSDRRETFTGWDAPMSGVKPARAAEVAATAPPAPGFADNQEVGDIRGRIDIPELTAREQEVLLLLIKGRNSRFIGETLNITVNTVKYHVRNLYAKFQVTNRQELLDVIEEINGKDR